MFLLCASNSQQSSFCTSQLHTSLYFPLFSALRRDPEAIKQMRLRCEDPSPFLAQCFQTIQLLLAHTSFALTPGCCVLALLVFLHFFGFVFMPRARSSHAHPTLLLLLSLTVHVFILYYRLLQRQGYHNFQA